MEEQYAKYDIEIKRGEDFAVSFQWLDDNGDPLSFEGYQWQAQLRETYDSAAAYDFTITTIPAEGKVELFMGYETTQNIMLHNGVYDLLYQHETGHPRKFLVVGDVKIIGSVTK